MEAEIESALVALGQAPDPPDVYEEEDAAEILLAYKEARQASKDHRLGRGYRSNPVTGRTQAGKAYRIQGKLNLQELIARTRCKICRTKGHWARDCPNKDKVPSKGDKDSKPGKPESSFSSTWPTRLARMRSRKRTRTRTSRSTPR